MYRRWKESGGKDDEYKTIIVRQVKTSQTEALKDGVTSESLMKNNTWEWYNTDIVGLCNTIILTAITPEICKIETERMTTLTPGTLILVFFYFE